MTDTAASGTRAGGQCPPWCATDHAEPLVPGLPELGPRTVHWSHSNTHAGGLAVALVQFPGQEPAVCLADIYAEYPVYLSAESAGNLAALLELPGAQAAALPSLLRGAAAALACQDPA